MSQKDLGLDVYDERFQDPQIAAEYLESVRWPNGPVCPHCGESERQAYFLKNQTRRLWKCAACRKQFTVTVGTRIAMIRGMERSRRASGSRVKASGGR